MNFIVIVRLTLLDERRKGTDVAVHLCESLLRLFQVLLLGVVFAPLQFIIGSGNTRSVIANNDLDVLILRFLLEVLELEFTEECLVTG